MQWQGFLQKPLPLNFPFSSKWHHMSQLLAFSLNCIFYKLHHSRVLLSFMSRQQGHNCTNNSTTKSAAHGNELAARHTEHLERKAAHPHSKKVEIRMRSITTSLPSALPISIWSCCFLSASLCTSINKKTQHLWCNCCFGNFFWSHVCILT